MADARGPQRDVQDPPGLMVRLQEGYIANIIPHALLHEPDVHEDPLAPEPEEPAPQPPNLAPLLKGLEVDVILQEDRGEIVVGVAAHQGGHKCP